MIQNVHWRLATAGCSASSGLIISISMPSLWESPRKDSPRRSTRMVRPVTKKTLIPLGTCPEANGCRVLEALCGNRGVQVSRHTTHRKRDQQRNTSRCSTWIATGTKQREKGTTFIIWTHHPPNPSLPWLRPLVSDLDPACNVNADGATGQKDQVVVLGQRRKKLFSREEDPSQHAIAKGLREIPVRQAARIGQGQTLQMEYLWNLQYSKILILAKAQFWSDLFDFGSY